MDFGLKLKKKLSNNLEMSLITVLNFVIQIYVKRFVHPSSPKMGLSNIRKQTEQAL